MRPIDIGEVIPRIVGKAITSCLRSDIINANGNLQLGTWTRSRCEIAVHASASMFEDEENHGILQKDSSNMLNSINRAAVLHNMATDLFNCYQIPVRLFISGGKELQSNEGTTQGYPVVMGMDATGVFPLLHLNETSNKMNESTIRLAFTDFTGASKSQELKSWWDGIVSHGPNIGYCPKAN